MNHIYSLLISLVIISNMQPVLSQTRPGGNDKYKPQKTLYFEGKDSLSKSYKSTTLRFYFPDGNLESEIQIDSTKQDGYISHFKYYYYNSGDSIVTWRIDTVNRDTFSLDIKTKSNGVKKEYFYSNEFNNPSALTLVSKIISYDSAGYKTLDSVFSFNNEKLTLQNVERITYQFEEDKEQKIHYTYNQDGVLSYIRKFIEYPKVNNKVNLRLEIKIDIENKKDADTNFHYVHNPTNSLLYYIDSVKKSNGKSDLVYISIMNEKDDVVLGKGQIFAEDTIQFHWTFRNSFNEKGVLIMEEYLEENIYMINIHSDFYQETPASLAKNETSIFKIFPNPVKDKISLILPENLPTSVQIFTPDGMVVKKEIELSNIIDVSDLQTGMYFLELTSAYWIKKIKFIKE